ncbi:fumarylacetoacetate hydrolase family protein [Actinokineospora pegani]|uniref:fumarylacetoacetate hydrolase family protein n=1 Tax=Actinokineospora pegani TaxID=2654637 RepID=UPI0012EA4568|nr:fumarylacetoacetate hydrolase family protein [Actinokineospora pegani]
MSTDILRTNDSWWVERPGGRAVRVDTAAADTAALLADRRAVDNAADSSEEGVPVGDLALESPVTAPCRVVAQLINYRSHAKDSGVAPNTGGPTFFRKASGSITGPHGAITTPEHVRLLDYEVELGLVLGAELPVGAVVTDDDLPHHIAGLVVANDVSARDVQLTKGQFYESKSYPTFTPVGPRLTLLGPGDLANLPNLRLRLWVNDELRQDSTTADMIVRPAQALTALARFQTLSPGDLVLTGTPGGTALKAPPKLVEKAGSLVPPTLKWKVFFARQAKNPHYLRAGDVVTARIATPDGALDLGSQRCTVA